MNDLRHHERWPDLREAGRRSRAAREQVLKLWPEDTSPEELAADQHLALERAHAAVVAADQEYNILRATITGVLNEINESTAQR